MQYPETAEQLAEALARAASHSRIIELEGNGTKRSMGGAVRRADEHISTARLNRVLQYEPHDLTISVEAGLPWCDFTGRLAANRQMVPLDPPFASSATVGGVIAANCSGPRRRLYGTARDLVIGMTFATVEGELVKSGGMVVKNVAGLDMAKLLSGSFGTLAAIAVVNFKLIPAPDVERSFLLPFESAAAAIAARNRILSGVLQPAALDLLNPAAAAKLGNAAWLLAVRVGGNLAAVDRYERELAALADGVALEGDRHTSLWRYVEEFTPGYLARHREAVVVRVSCTLKDVEPVMAAFPGPAIARAGSGVAYGYFEDSVTASAWAIAAIARGWVAVLEFSPAERKTGLDLWPSPRADFELMRRVKHLFDPTAMLNPGRLYGRI